MARESSTADFRLLEAMHDRTPLARSLAALVLDHLFPRFCLGCGTRLAGGTSPLLLCPPCRGRLERVDPRSTCSGCVRPLPAGRLSRPRCLDCLRDPPPFDRLVAVWRYRPPLDRVLWAFKFGRLDFLADALVAEALALSSGAPLEGAAGYVPIPLAPPRRIVRGFNQAERIARALSQRLGPPCRELLVRPGWRATPQRRLGRRQRRSNPDVRFVAGRRGAFDGPLALIDDVVTTGSTLRAASAALRRAGCDRLFAWVLAATPADGPVPGSPPASDSP